MNQVEKALLLLSLEEANIMTVCEINCIQDEDQAEVSELRCPAVLLYTDG